MAECLEPSPPFSGEGFAVKTSAIGFSPTPSEARSDSPNDELGLPWTRPEHRFDAIPVKLEKRGVTSHATPLRWRQGTLFLRETVWREAITSKLDAVHRNELADRIRLCHTDKSFRQCRGCQKTSAFFNRCENFWCPICAGRLAAERRSAIEWWTREIHQPKHMVLTVRNTANLTKDYVQGIKAAYGRLRRRKFARHWHGGFYRLETTNEGRGFHLHIHSLIDAVWIDAGELAKEWASLVGQDFAIVKVKDARGSDYLAEVTKYLVKGDTLAGWSGEDIAQFVDAFDGVRTFGVFGSLYGKRTEFAEWIAEIREHRITCECGCSKWRILAEDELEWQEIERELTAAIPPPTTVRPTSQINTMELFG